MFQFKHLDYLTGGVVYPEGYAVTTSKHSQCDAVKAKGVHITLKSAGCHGDIYPKIK